MSHLNIAHINRADAATLTASPSVEAAMPVSYLQNDHRGYVMRSTGLTAQQIKGEWGGAAHSVGCCALYRHNLVSGDTWRLQLYSDTAWTTQVHDTGTVSAFTSGLFDNWDFGFSVLWFSAVSGVKSFKLTLTSSTNPDGYIEAGRLFLGPYLEASYNPKYGARLGYAGNAIQARSYGGSLLASEREKWREIAFDIMTNTEAQRAAWLEISRYAGIEKTVLLSVFPGHASAGMERDYALMGKFVTPPEQVISGYSIYDHEIKLTEI